MPVFEIGLDDGRKLRVEADNEEAALAGVAHFKANEGPKAPAPVEKSTEPSGVLAGISHGFNDTVRGNMETAKSYAGVGPGGKREDDNYVPANVSNGSFNPLKWNYS